MSGHESRTQVHTVLGEAAGGGTESTSAAVAMPAAPVPVPGVATSGSGLWVGHADDPAERAADRLADTALRRLSALSSDAAGPGSTGGRHEAGCGHLRRASAPTPAVGAAIGREGGAVPAPLAGKIEAARGTGSPLAGPQRQRMESAFGTALGHVRVHRGEQAARLNDAVSAEAFTIGTDVFLGDGLAARGPDAERVLAHELAHVISEPAGVRREIRRWGVLKKLAGKVGSVASGLKEPGGLGKIAGGLMGEGGLGKMASGLMGEGGLGKIAGGLMGKGGLGKMASGLMGEGGLGKMASGLMGEGGLGKMAGNLMGGGGLGEMATKLLGPKIGGFASQLLSSFSKVFGTPELTSEEQAAQQEEDGSAQDAKQSALGGFNPLSMISGALGGGGASSVLSGLGGFGGGLLGALGGGGIGSALSGAKSKLLGGGDPVSDLLASATQGDNSALGMLSKFKVDGKPIGPDLLGKLSPSALLGDTDPADLTDPTQSRLLAKIRSSVMGSVTGAAKAGAEAVGAGGEDLGWRVQMFANASKRLAAKPAPGADEVAAPPGITCVVGGIALARNASSGELKAFAEEVSVNDLKAELSQKPRRNPPEAIDMIRDLIQLKAGSDALGAAAS